MGGDDCSVYNVDLYLNIKIVIHKCMDMYLNNADAIRIINIIFMAFCCNYIFVIKNKLCLWLLWMFFLVLIVTSFKPFANISSNGIYQNHFLGDYVRVALCLQSLSRNGVKFSKFHTNFILVGAELIKLFL